MSANIRNTPALLDNAKIDRTTTAIMEYQMQVETAALIRSAEDLQALIRQLQEAWLFGQLNTTGNSKVQDETNENARQVAELLKKLLDHQDGSPDEIMSGG
nr:mediator of rna polymerase ii transcription subunit 22 [Quercus suber]